VSVERPREPILSSRTVARAARIGIVAWAAVGIAVLVFLFGRFVLYPIRIVFPPIVVAVVVVYLLNPIVSVLERRGVGRIWGTLLTYVTVLAAIGVALVYIIPVVSHQAVQFSKDLPRFLDRAQEGLSNLARKLGLTVNGNDLFESFKPKGAAARFFARLTSAGAGAVRAVITALLGIVVAFYLLVDLPKLKQAVKSAVPARRRAEALDLGTKLSTAVGGYFRGQLLVAAFVAAASMGGLWLVGMPYWAPVGLIAGLFNLVPLIGPFIGAIPALFIAFSTDHRGPGPIRFLSPGWKMAVGASVVLLVIQQIDNHLISPRVVHRTVKLHPLTVMLSLLAAGTVLGLWGMLLVIPVVAAAKILLVHYWDTRMVWPPNAPEQESVAPADAPAAQASSAAGSPRREQRPPRKVSAATGVPGNGADAKDPSVGRRTRETIKSALGRRRAGAPRD
jgi:predicted PurR-regulated permease PerM